MNYGGIAVSRKPSMFSKNYRKELKQRKIRRIVLMVGAILIIGVTVISFDKGKSIFENYVVKNSKGNIVDKEKGEEVEQPELNETEVPVEEEKSSVSFEAKLISGKSVLVELKEDNNKKVISNIQCPEAVKGIISPSLEKGLIIDEATQDIYIVDTSQGLKNVTNQQYISTTNDTYTKDSVLQYTPGYKWVEGAAFIDDSHVAYSSQLPWINEGGDRYLWIVNIDDNSHNGYYNIKGNSFTFGETKNDRVSIDVDGRVIEVNSQGKIVTN